jgi:serine phosphatase RsbU (regulator of sigma subunit)
VARPPADRDRPAAPAVAVTSNRSGWQLHFGAVTVLLVGVLVTGGLAFGAQSVHDSNEDRLLRQRVREAAAVVTAATPAVQTPLVSAAVLAEATNAEPVSFRRLMTPLVTARGPFISASVWSADAAQPRPLVVVGAQPELAARSSNEVRGFLRDATSRTVVSIENLLAASDRRLGYAYAAPGGRSRFVVYAETALPKNRRATIEKDSAFADLGYAIYLGGSPDSRQLLASSTGGALPQGRRASVAVPYADSKLLLVMTPHKELGGSLLARLPWLLAGFGLLFMLAATVLVERLLRRREDAESLAGENARLYAEQRTVAQTLQHSLLPDTFPEIAGLEVATRYVAGVEGIDVGGDWYDLVELDDGRLLFVVGDVSGRGLHAATMMASLRHAIRAYAAQGDAPETILTKLSGLISVVRDGHFATVLCGTIDVAGHRVTLANAGHPEPLLISDQQAKYVATTTGVPVGVPDGPPYSSITFSIPPDATLLAYTDGLVERRRESLDVGLERLKHAALGSDGTLEALLTQILTVTIPTGADDDSAILGVRWRS